MWPSIPAAFQSLLQALRSPDHQAAAIHCLLQSAVSPNLVQGSAHHMGVSSRHAADDVSRLQGQICCSDYHHAVRWVVFPAFPTSVMSIRPCGFQQSFSTKQRGHAASNSLTPRQALQRIDMARSLLPMLLSHLTRDTPYHVWHLL